MFFATTLPYQDDGFSRTLLRDAEESNTVASQTFMNRRSSQQENASSRRMAICDRLYGQVLFPPVFDVFIDSPQVQRLRDLKQLGNAHYVYPGATNTRFEHSLGTAHLAMTFLKQLFANHQEEPDYIESSPATLSPTSPPPPRDPVLTMLTSEYDSATKDLWCVGLAGLCHDLGHGPLSHMFERYVGIIRRREGKSRWHHEMASLGMVDAIWEANRERLISEFNMTDEDLAFIKVCITGLSPEEPWSETRYGRPEWKRFMVEIVANKRNGLDVDKLDYLQRDSMCCFGLPSLTSLSRLFQGARVMADMNGQYQIAFQEKLDSSVDTVFNVRANLHRTIYQHRVSRVMDAMTIDAFVSAHESFVLHDDNGKSYRLSECVDYPEVYVKTGDWIVKAMMNRHDEGMRRAREILERISTRDIYTSVRSFDPPTTRGDTQQGSRGHGEEWTGQGGPRGWQGQHSTPDRIRAPGRPQQVSTPRPRTSHEEDDDRDEVSTDSSSLDLICTPLRTTPVSDRMHMSGNVTEAEFYQFLLRSPLLSEALRTKMEAWQDANDGLAAATLITVRVSKVASEMDPREEPLTHVGFFENRSIGRHAAHSALTRCRYPRRRFKPLQPEVRYVMVSRMPLTTEERASLSHTLKQLLTPEQKESGRDFSATPIQLRPPAEDAHIVSGIEMFLNDNGVDSPTTNLTPPTPQGVVDIVNGDEDLLGVKRVRRETDPNHRSAK